MVAASTPVEIFCSYAHEDEVWLRKLETHLILLKRQGLISLWHDRLIVPGTDWARTIDTYLETASVILLLVSADFFASDYCYGIEMKRALERQEVGEARIIPILVRQVDWIESPLAHLQALPSDAKPLAIWQDEDTALADITAGIRRVIVEVLPHLSASAPRTALPKIWDIPYPRNPFFLGRESELAQMRLRLQAGQTTALSQPQAISGLGGIGKTQLALEYAYRYHQDYTAVLWARAESKEALISSYISLAALLQLPEREAKEQDIIVLAVKNWLQVHRNWLLILDNADELSLLPDFLSSSQEGHVLLTTRAAATGRLARRMEIETLLPQQGALFLLRRAALIEPFAELSQASEEERELAMHISQQFGGLPLALDQAGAYLEETGTDLTSYWQIYQQHRADLLRERRGQVADHPAPVATTWSISFQKVEERNPNAAELLRLCVCLSPDAIPEEILVQGALFLRLTLSPAGVDAFLLNQALEVLRSYSLVSRNPREKTLSIHRLVQAVLRDQMDEQSRQEWAERTVRTVNAAFPLVEYQVWVSCDRILPHAMVCTDLIEAYHLISSEAVQLLNQTGFYLKERARYIEAELLLQRALSICEQHLGFQQLDTATSLNRLALLYDEQGRYIEAEPLYLQALAIREQQLGSLHPDTANSLNNLAALYARQEKYEKAEPLYRRALMIREQQLGPLHRKTAASHNNLAFLYHKQGRDEQAELLYRQVLTFREQQLGPLHPDTAETIHYFAQFREAQNKSEEARAGYARALAIREQILGMHHPKTTETRKRLITLLHSMGQHEEAAKLEAAQFEQ